MICRNCLKSCGLYSDSGYAGNELVAPSANLACRHASCLYLMMCCDRIDLCHNLKFVE